MKKLFYILLIPLSIFAQVTYQKSKFDQVWYDASYEKAHSTFALFDTSSIKLYYTATGKPLFDIYDQAGLRVFHLDSLGVTHADSLAVGTFLYSGANFADSLRGAGFTKDVDEWFDSNGILSAGIKNGAILNEDINASANIAGSKLADNGITYAKLDTGATGFVDVRKFGAVGDGVTDDEPAFQAIADLVNAGDSLSIYLPPGKYRMADSVRFRRGNISIRGAGGQSIIIPDNNLTTLFLYREDDGDSSWVSHVGKGSFELQDLRFDCSNVDTTSGAYHCAVVVYGLNRVFINNVIFDPLMDFSALRIDNSDNVTITNCLFKDKNYSYGALNVVNILDTGWENAYGTDKSDLGYFRKRGNTTISDNIFKNYKYFAINVVGVSTPNVTITGNKCINGEHHAIALETDPYGSGYVERVNISFNVVDSLSYANASGIYVQSWESWIVHNLSIVGNTIRKTPIGIKVMADNCTISSNTIDEFGTAGIELYQRHNYSYRNQHNAAITGNVMRGASGAGRFGIFVDNPKELTIIGNVVSDIDTTSGASLCDTTTPDYGHGIFLQGTSAQNFTVSHNVIKNIWGGGIVLGDWCGYDSLAFRNYTISDNIITDVSLAYTDDTTYQRAGICLGNSKDFSVHDNIITDSDSTRLEYGISQGGTITSSAVKTEGGEFKDNIIRGATTPIAIKSGFRNKTTVSWLNNAQSTNDTLDVFKKTYSGNVNIPKGLNIGRSYIGKTSPSNGALVQGYVGIGTTNPLYPLSVSGAATFNGTIWNDHSSGYLAKGANTGVVGLISGNNASENAKLVLYGNAYTSASYRGDIDIQYGGNPAGTDGDLASEVKMIYLDDSGNFNERFRLTSAGSVGIGTTNPTSKLHVSGGGIKSDSVSVGAGGIWQRDWYYNAADSSIRIVFYNSILSRIDTVKCPQP